MAERIAKIEKELWLLEFKDHWDNRDWALKNELEKELNKLKNNA
jgi:hypothetical protein